jgi:hypothetical protein
MLHRIAETLLYIAPTRFGQGLNDLGEMIDLDLRDRHRLAAAGSAAGFT